MSELAELPPAMPKVIMDIGMGQRAEYLDFNYDTFYELAKEEHISDQDINKLTIHFSSKPSSRLFNALGMYVHLRKRITVYSEGFEYDPAMEEAEGDESSHETENSLTNEECGNIVVRHEMGHWVNQLGPRIGERERLINTVVILGGAVISLTSMVALPVLTKEWATLAIPIPAYFGGMFGYSKMLELKHGEEWLYDSRLTPHEKPAYEYEEKTKNRDLLKYIPREEAGTITENE